MPADGMRAPGKNRTSARPAGSYGTADIDWPPAPIASEAYDPKVVLRAKANSQTFPPVRK